MYVNSKGKEEEEEKVKTLEANAQQNIPGVPSEAVRPGPTQLGTARLGRRVNLRQWEYHLLRIWKEGQEKEEENVNEIFSFRLVAAISF